MRQAVLTENLGWNRLYKISHEEHFISKEGGVFGVAMQILVVTKFNQFYCFCSRIKQNE